MSTSHTLLQWHEMIKSKTIVRGEGRYFAADITDNSARFNSVADINLKEFWNVYYYIETQRCQLWHENDVCYFQIIARRNMGIPVYCPV